LKLLATTAGDGTAGAATTLYLYKADGNTTSYARHANGNVVTTITPLATTTYQYDHDGNQVSATDPLTRTIASQYDGNELVGEIWYNADGSTQNTLSFSYGAAGNLLTAGDNAGTDTFTYSGDQVATQTDTNNLTLTFGYDEEGNDNGDTLRIHRPSFMLCRNSPPRLGCSRRSRRHVRDVRQPASNPRTCHVGTGQ
jgi:YD repeat-containing protein